MRPVDGLDRWLARGKAGAWVTAGAAGGAAAGLAYGPAVVAAAATTGRQAYVIGTLSAATIAQLIQSSSGRVVTVFTRLTQFPAADRVLHAATDPRLAQAVRGERTMFVGRIPYDLYQRLLADGHIREATTQMGGVTGREIIFSAEAMRILQQFFSGGG